MKLLYLFFAFINHAKIYFRIKTFQKRFFILRKTGKDFQFKKRDEKILVVIAHVVPEYAISMEKLSRLKECLDALGKSLASFDSKIVLLTKENFSLHENLPGYLREKTEIYYSHQEDPLFVEYDAYDVFSSHFGQYDYFLFMEDDIILSDSWFLEKIKKFNQLSRSLNYVLLPHRYEYCNGVKYYFDQTTVRDGILKTYRYTESLKIIFDDGIKFCMFENPHAAFYCLNKDQMQRWIKSGYEWKNKVVAFGVLESAATFSQYENFEFFNPHPDNISYFEVQHYGNKYILNDGIMNAEE